MHRRLSIGFVVALVICALVVSSFRPVIAHEGDDKRPLTHDDYDRWNTIEATRVSNDGKWLMYSIVDGKDDQTLILRSAESSREYKVQRGKSGQFSFDSKFAAYRIGVDDEAVKKLKKDETDERLIPRPKFELIELESGKNWTHEGVKAFGMPEESGAWIAWLLDEEESKKTVVEQNSKVKESWAVTESGLVRPEERNQETKTVEEQASEEAALENEKEERQEEKGKTEEQSEEQEEKTEKSQSSEESDDEEKQKEKDDGTTLVLRNLETGVEQRIPFVTHSAFSKFGKLVVYATSNKDDEENEGVTVLDLESGKRTKIISGLANYEKLVVDESESRVAFLTDRDDYESEHAEWAIYCWKTGQKEAKLVATRGTKGVPDDWWVPKSSDLEFSENGKRLYFGTAPISEEALEEDETDGEDSDEREDDEDEEKKAKLDIWHWKDPLIQPQQLIEVEEERKRTYLAVYQTSSKRIVQLADKELPDVYPDEMGDAKVLIGFTNVPYKRQITWEYPVGHDLYLVDVKSGERKLIVQRQRGTGEISPRGQSLAWWDADERQWMCLATDGVFDLEEDEPLPIVNASKTIPYPLFYELHDTPSVPFSYGLAGFVDRDGAELPVINDRFDMWLLDPTGALDAVCVTAGHGRDSSTRFRYLRLDRELDYIPMSESVVLSAFDETTKASGYFALDIATQLNQDVADEDNSNTNEENDSATNDESAESKRDLDDDNDVWSEDATLDLSDEQREEIESDEQTAGDLGESSDLPAGMTQLIMLDERLRGLNKAREAETIVFTRSTFERCPDIWQSTLKFDTIKRISRVNPQQHEYTWGTVELTEWQGTDGQRIEGLLYKPDDFDPSKKYPMLVYFYERNSDNLHAYYAPAAGRSIINHSFYVSRGYVLFVPDIPYTTGAPGPSAANSVIPGVEHVVSKGFVDADRIGMQGHSWGGYQTAYLVTQTDMFACAESGAPVSNMTSAYGGIRWGSGRSRMFQYERTQSRIGDTLWKAREKYIANSPLFAADKINTPLLILHNDEDGAVPWYQGIELFMAMRRLEKPAWLLNYNGDPHWVMGQDNRRDFAKRMQQFFDHYLKDGPLPIWMADGVPAVRKGEDFGFEEYQPNPIEPEKRSSTE